MNFEAIVNVLSFILDVVKEAININRKLPEIYISSATIVSDRNVNSESFYIDCFAMNTSSRPITVFSFAIVSARSGEFKCSIDDFGKFGGYTMANPFPMVLQPDEARRVIIEFNYETGLSKLMDKINGRNGRKLYLRAHTSAGDLGIFIRTSFHESMEDWYWSRLHAMRDAKTM